MNDQTICHSMGARSLFADVPSDQTGSLVRIYPAAGAGGMWDLECSEVFLGRDYDCDVQLDDDAASRRHAAIQQDEEGYLLVDLNSTNGTYVNNEQIKQHRLRAGDRIRIGEHVLKYLSSDHIEKQYHETVFRMTTRDGLTEAFNRQYMSEFLEREISRSVERGRAMSVAMLDIDHFKSINDTYGHLAGDEVLRELCDRASQVLHAGDLFARYGGEEFCCVFCESDSQEARKLAEAIRSEIQQRPFCTNVGDLSITASIGLATWTGQQQTQPTVESFLSIADKQLYVAKESGRNQVRATEL